MTPASEPQQQIETYLDNLRGRMRGINRQEVGEIIEELRSHITEKATLKGSMTAAEVETALANLGTPEELASQYLSDELLARANVSRSPIKVLERLFYWASLGGAGVFVFLGTLLGYFLGIVFVLCAILKPIHPHTAGLWIIPDIAGDSQFSIQLGFGHAPVGGREALGWWVVPLRGRG